MTDSIAITPVFVPQFDLEGKLSRISCYQGTEQYTDGSVGLSNDNVTIYVSDMKWGDKDKGTVEINWCAMGSQDVKTAERFAEALTLATRVVGLLGHIPCKSSKDCARHTEPSDFYKIIMMLNKDMDHETAATITEVAGIRIAAHRGMFFPFPTKVAR